MRQYAIYDLMLTYKMMIRIILFLPLVIAHTADDENRLRTSLFRSYNKQIRPPYNVSATLQVKVEFYLSAINDIDDVKGLMTSIGRFLITWEDDRLSWNSSEYSGLFEILVNGSTIWGPNLFAINTIDLQSLNKGSIMTRIYNNGSVYASIGIRLRTYFDSQMTYFPFDTQNCKIHLYPYGYSSSDVQLQVAKNKIDTWSYSENSGWDLIDTAAKPYCLNHLCGMVEFELVLKRRHIYFSVSMLSPLVILSAINPMVFLMPIDSGERVSFSVTMLLSFGVFLSEISNSMPEVSDPMAYLSYYILFTIIGSAYVCIMTILTTNMYYKGPSNVAPIWVRLILKILSLEFLKYLVCFCCFWKKRKGNKDPLEADKETTNISSGEKEQMLQDLSWKEAAEKLNYLAAVYCWLSFIAYKTSFMFILCFQL